MLALPDPLLSAGEAGTNQNCDALRRSADGMASSISHHYPPSEEHQPNLQAASRNGRIKKIDPLQIINTGELLFISNKDPSFYMHPKFLEREIKIITAVHHARLFSISLNIR